MYRASITADPRAHLLALLRAGLLAGAGLLIVVLPAAAADPSSEPGATPSAAPSTEPSLSAEPSPSAEPAPGPAATASPPLSPAADPTPAPTATPSTEPTSPPGPTPPPEPTPTPTPSPTPTPNIESKLIYRASAITRQYTNYWCVPASTQTMWNLIKGISNRTVRRQGVLYTQIRAHNRYHYRTLGNDVQGWAWGLRRYTRIPYAAKSYTTRTQAITAIVEAIKRTGHPVGITVKRGTHAWVVLGYKVAVDALDPTKRTILGLYVMGPLGVGRDPYPYRYMTLARIGGVYTKYHESTRSVIWEGRYVIVAD